MNTADYTIKEYTDNTKVVMTKNGELHGWLHPEDNISKQAVRKLVLEGSGYTDITPVASNYYVFFAKKDGKSVVVKFVEYCSSSLAENYNAKSIHEFSKYVKNSFRYYPLLEEGIVVTESYPGYTVLSLSLLTNTDIQTKAKLMLSLATQLSCLHKANFAHRDIKPDNILVNAELTIAVFIDFGASSYLEKTNETNKERKSHNKMEIPVRDCDVCAFFEKEKCDVQQKLSFLHKMPIGTNGYMDPWYISIDKADQETDDESYLKRNQKGDIWSLACVFYQIVYGRLPFSSDQANS